MRKQLQVRDVDEVPRQTADKAASHRGVEPADQLGQDLRRSDQHEAGEQIRREIPRDASGQQGQETPWIPAPAWSSHVDDVDRFNRMKGVIAALTHKSRAIAAGDDKV